MPNVQAFVLIHVKKIDALKWIDFVVVSQSRRGCSPASDRAASEFSDGEQWRRRRRLQQQLHEDGRLQRF